MLHNLYTSLVTSTQQFLFNKIKYELTDRLLRCAEVQHAGSCVEVSTAERPHCPQSGADLVLVISKQRRLACTYT